MKITKWIFFDSKTKNKIRNTFDNNMTTDIKHSKIQLTKLIQSGRIIGNTIGKLGKEALTNLL